MSPTEDDLRRALSDGAGDVPDAGHIAFRAREQRDRRRKQVLAAVATVIVVGGIATGGTLLARGGNDTESAGSDATHATVPATRSGAAGANAPAGTSGTDQGGTHGTEATCPSNVPTNVLPGGGGTNQFGATGKLFARAVSSVTVCAYPSVARSGGSVPRIVLSGAEAGSLTDSLENAARTRPRVACPMYRTTAQATLAIIATASDGRQLPTVTTTVNEPACAVVVSNGTAVRYDWSWPATMAAELRTLLGSTHTSGGLPSTGISPVH